MDLRLFPSRPIAVYIGKIFFLRSLSVLFALVFLLQALDTINVSQRILAEAGNDDSDVWQYVFLRVPQLISEFLPFSVLLGTFLTLLAFNQNSELIVMRAGGMSTHQVIIPLVAVGLIFALVHFVLNETAVTRSNNILTAWEKNDFAEYPEETNSRYNIWLRMQTSNIHVGRVAEENDKVTLHDITIYEIEDGRLLSLIRADKAYHLQAGSAVLQSELSAVSSETDFSASSASSASPVAAISSTSATSSTSSSLDKIALSREAWRMTNIEKFTVRTNETESIDSAVAMHDMRPEQFALAQVDGTVVPFWLLIKMVQQMDTLQYPTGKLLTTLWQKIVVPLSSALMPLLGAMTAFGLARSGRIFLRGLIGFAVGFCYFIVDNYASSMGQAGAYPPLIAAWGPLFLFFMLGETFIIREEL